MLRTAAAALLVLLASVAPSVAGERDAEASGNAAPATATSAVARDAAWSLPPIGLDHPRGAGLSGLYVSLAALNAVDGITTAKGLHSGTATEANVMLGSVARNSAALWALKAGSTAVTIVLAERLRRDGHRGQAIAVMILSNSLMATVVANNAHVLTQGR